MISRKGKCITQVQLGSKQGQLFKILEHLACKLKPKSTCSSFLRECETYELAWC